APWAPEAEPADADGAAADTAGGATAALATVQRPISFRGRDAISTVATACPRCQTGACDEFRSVATSPTGRAADGVSARLLVSRQGMPDRSVSAWALGAAGGCRVRAVGAAATAAFTSARATVGAGAAGATVPDHRGAMALLSLPPLTGGGTGTSRAVLQTSGRTAAAWATSGAGTEREEVQVPL